MQGFDYYLDLSSFLAYIPFVVTRLTPDSSSSFQGFFRFQVGQSITTRFQNAIENPIFLTFINSLKKCLTMLNTSLILRIVINQQQEKLWRVKC